MAAPHLSIQAVAHRTGLSPHVIRVWERRYGAVTPARTAAQQRRYSEEEVGRLNLLRRITRAGHSIGSIAHLPTRQLQRLIEPGDLEETARNAGTSDAAAELRAECILAVKSFDTASMDDGLRRSLLALGHQGFLRRIVGPLAEEIGVLWRSGAITAAHEHFFTAAVKMFLGDLSRQFAPAGHAPRLIACTPQGQLHELGAFMAAVSAVHLGWHAVYLGASLPAAEIAGAAIQQGASVVVLSLVYPQDDPRLAGELRTLRRLLPPATRLIVGGRVARAYQTALDDIGATVVVSLEHFSEEIDTLRISASLATPKSRAT